MKKIMLLFLLFTSIAIMAQTNITIIPKPVELTVQQGTFSMNSSTVIIANSTAKHDAEMLNFYLEKLYGLTLRVIDLNPSAPEKNCIVLDLLNPGGRKKDE